MTDPAVLTVPEVAELCRVTEWTVGEWTRTGVLPRLPGRRIRIPAFAVHELLEGQYIVSNAKSAGETQAQATTPRRGNRRAPQGSLAGEAVGGGRGLPRRIGPATGDVGIRRVEGGG